MSDFIEELELKMWKDQLDRAEEAVRKAKAEVDNDPTNVILDCNLKFKELLDNNKGEARHTKAFQNQVSHLAALEKRAKLRMKTFDLITALNYHSDKMLERDMIAQKYNMVKFQYDIRRRIISI